MESVFVRTSKSKSTEKDDAYMTKLFNPDVIMERAVDVLGLEG